MAKFRIKGMGLAYMDELKKTEVLDAFCELIDNAADAQATEIRIEYGQNRYGEGYITVSDDGIGMSKETLTKVGSDYKCHIQTSDNPIGIRGMGMKNALIRLANYNDNGDTGRVQLATETGNGRRQRLDWVIARKESLIESIDVDSWPIGDDTSSFKHGHGTRIRLSNCELISKRVWNKIKHFIAKTYAKRISEGLNILISTDGGQNFDRVAAADPLYLHILGDDINTPGVYVKNGIVFHVTEPVFVNINNHREMHSIRMVSVFFSPQNDSWERNHYVCKIGNLIYEDKAQERNAGIYAMYGGRLINLGGNVVNMIGRDVFFAGQRNMRVCLFITPETIDIFDVPSNKNQGIKNLADEKSDRQTNNYVMKELTNSEGKAYGIVDWIRTLYNCMAKVETTLRDTTSTVEECGVSVTEEYMENVFTNHGITDKRKLNNKPVSVKRLDKEERMVQSGFTPITENPIIIRKLDNNRCDVSFKENILPIGIDKAFTSDVCSLLMDGRYKLTQRVAVDLAFKIAMLQRSEEVPQNNPG